MLEKLTPILMIASLALAFAVGVLWNKVSALESAAGKSQVQVKNDTTNVGSGTTTTTGAGLPTTVTKLTESQSKKIPAVSASDYYRGNKNAKVTLIEYSDLECPFCKQFHETMKQVMTDYKGEVAWVFRHYPIKELHPKAPKEAEATECANQLGGQDAFWKLTDKIYEVTPANNGLVLSDLPKLANGIGLNQAKFEECLDSGKYADAISKYVQAAKATGATGTPANFVVNKNGEMWIIPGALPLESVKTILDEALQS